MKLLTVALVLIGLFGTGCGNQTVTTSVGQPQSPDQTIDPIKSGVTAEEQAVAQTILAQANKGDLIEIDRDVAQLGTDTVVVRSKNILTATEKGIDG